MIVWIAPEENAMRSFTAYFIFQLYRVCDCKFVEVIKNAKFLVAFCAQNHFKFSKPDSATSWP